MPDTIANNGTAVPDMSRSAAKAIYPNGGRNRTAARVQAALLRGLVGLHPAGRFCGGAAGRPGGVPVL